MKLNLLSLISLMVLALTSCQKDTTEQTVEEYVESTVYDLQASSRTGKDGCFELVFPISIAFPDNTTETYNDYEELKTGLKSWRENHEPGSGRPSFVFPISVIAEDGSTIVVENQEELKELRSACPNFKNRGHKGHFLRGLKCFDINYPVTLVFPNATEIIVTNQAELMEAAKTWRKNNPRAKAHPIIKLPFSVTIKDDGNVVTIDSRDDLKELKELCRG